MQIFVSYSRRDAGDFAHQIRSHFASFEKYDVFTDVNSIRVGEVWSSAITDNISNCDVFVVIVTDGALHSPHVENEVLQAQREKKMIIPCFHRSVRKEDIKWRLDKVQGIEFEGMFELARTLYSRIVDAQPVRHESSKLRERPNESLQRAQKSRPTGVTMIAILTIIIGLIFLFGALENLSIVGVGSVILSGGLLVVAYLVLSYLVWKGKRWAWTITLISAVISIVLGIVGFVGNLDSVGLSLFYFVLTLLIIANFIVVYYLYRPTVKAFFGK